MQLGLNKCAKVAFIRGKISETSNADVEQKNAIKELESVGSYKILLDTTRGRCQAFADEGENKKIML